MEDREKLIEKIQKLLRLSQSPNEHEAALAAEKAQALLAEYNLSMDDVAKDIEEEFIIDSGLATESRPWRRQLGAMTAQLYFCRYFFTFHKTSTARRKCGYIRDDIHNFVGAQHNVIIAKMMFTYLCEAAIRAADVAGKKVPVKERGSYITSFKMACGWRLCKRIEERIQAARAGQIKTEIGTNLPALANLYDKAEQDTNEFLKRQGTKLTAGKDRSRQNHEAGIQDGWKAGADIGLEPQIDKTKVGHLLGG